MPTLPRKWHAKTTNSWRFVAPSTVRRAPVGQGPPGPGWLAISLGFCSGRALATGTAWAGLCLIHHHLQPTQAKRLLSPRAILCCDVPISTEKYLKSRAVWWLSITSSTPGFVQARCRAHWDGPRQTPASGRSVRAPAPRIDHVIDRKKRRS